MQVSKLEQELVDKQRTINEKTEVSFNYLFILSCCN